MWRTRLSARLVLVFGIMSLASHCLAAVVYSDLNSPLYSGGGIVLGSVAAAEIGEQPNFLSPSQIFESGGNFALSSVTVGTYYFPAQPGFPLSPTEVFSPNFDVWLYSNDQEVFEHGGTLQYQNVLGLPLEDLGQATAPNQLGLVTAKSHSGTMLAAGSLYWVVLTPANPDTLVVWGSTNTGESLEVDGRQITPEPSTLAFVALAGGVALVLAWKRRTEAAFDLL